MALSKNSKTYQALQEAIDNAEDKLERMQERSKAEWKLADFGFANNLLTRNPKNLTVSSARKRIKMLDEFGKDKYGITRISRSNDGQGTNWWTKEDLRDFQSEIDKENKFKKALYKGLAPYTNYYIRYTGNGKYEKVEKTMSATIDKKRASMLPVGFEVKGKDGITIGAKASKKVHRRKITISPEYLKTNQGKFKGKATNLGSKRVKNLYDNYFKALKNKTSAPFARSIKKILEEAGVDTIDFLGLYFTSGAFDFDFVYDETDLKLKKEIIKTEAKFIKDNPNYFDKLREQLTPFDEEEV